jgi:hypothetical protein
MNRFAIVLVAAALIPLAYLVAAVTGLVPKADHSFSKIEEAQRRNIRRGGALLELRLSTQWLRHLNVAGAMRDRVCHQLGIKKLTSCPQMKEFFEKSVKGEYGDAAAESAKMTDLISKAYPGADANAIYDKLTSYVNTHRDKEFRAKQAELAMALAEYKQWLNGDSGYPGGAITTRKIIKEEGFPSNRLIAAVGDRIVVGQTALDLIIALTDDSNPGAPNADPPGGSAPPADLNPPGPPPIDADLPGNPSARRIPLPTSDAASPAKN